MGGAAGLAALPIVIYVMKAARQSARARLGSLVAAMDRRAVWATLATTIALATLVSIPEWEGRAGIDRLPFVAFGVAAEMADGSAYRHQPRIVGLIVGDPVVVSITVRSGIKRSVAALVAVLGVLVLHVTAAPFGMIL